MTTWAQQAATFIAALDEDIPAGTSLQDRTRILNENAYFFHRNTSWGKKTWAKAKRAYLERHGQPKGKGLPKAPIPLFDQAPPMKSTAAGRAVSEQHRPAPIGGHQADLLCNMTTAAELQLFPSHPWTVRAAWEILGPLIFPAWPGSPQRVVINEPCAGLGHMVEPLRELFFHVRPSDVHDWGKGYPLADALAFEADDRSDLNVCFTNPPFDKPVKGMAARIVRQAQKSCQHVIILARLSFLCGAGRYPLHHANPAGNLRHILPLSERAPMQLGHYNPKCSKPQEYAFFHYERGFTGHATTINIAPGARARHFRPEDVKI